MRQAGMPEGWFKDKDIVSKMKDNGKYMENWKTIQSKKVTISDFDVFEKISQDDELVQHAMDVEDEIFDEFLRLGEENAELRAALMAKLEELQRKQQLISEKNKEIEQQKGVIEHQQNQLAVQQNQLAEKENQIRNVAKKLSAMGQSVEEIAEFLSVSVEKVKDYLE